MASDSKTAGNEKFASILTKLRKERCISQKTAAADLGISQALLSHYEKGIRECGLGFLIRCCKYYGVTADYILGISESRSGLKSDFFSLIMPNGDGNTVSEATRALMEKMLPDVGGDHAMLLQETYLVMLYRFALTAERAGVISKDLFSDKDLQLFDELSAAAIMSLSVRASKEGKNAASPAETSADKELKKALRVAEDYLNNNL